MEGKGELKVHWKGNPLCGTLFEHYKLLWLLIGILALFSVIFNQELWTYNSQTWSGRSVVFTYTVEIEDTVDIDPVHV